MPAQAQVSRFQRAPRLRVTNATLQYLIPRANTRYRADRIVGGPAWLDSDRYDIDAKTGDTPENLSGINSEPCCRICSPDRFGLKAHHETRQMTVYLVLVADKGETKLQKTTEADAAGQPNADRLSPTTVLTGTRFPLEQFSGYIGDKLSRVVVDKTELKGVYDFTLEWDPEQSRGRNRPIDVHRIARAIGAVCSRSQKTAVDAKLVIDSVRRPTGNSGMFCSTLSPLCAPRRLRKHRRRSTWPPSRPNHSGATRIRMSTAPRAAG